MISLLEETHFGTTPLWDTQHPLLGISPPLFPYADSRNSCITKSQGHRQWLSASNWNDHNMPSPWTDESCLLDSVLGPWSKEKQSLPRTRKIQELLVHCTKYLVHGTFQDEHQGCSIYQTYLYYHFMEKHLIESCSTRSIWMASSWVSGYPFRLYFPPVMRIPNVGNCWYWFSGFNLVKEWVWRWLGIG